MVQPGCYRPPSIILFPNPLLLEQCGDGLKPFKLDSHIRSVLLLILKTDDSYILNVKLSLKRQVKCLNVLLISFVNSFFFYDFVHFHYDNEQ